MSPRAGPALEGWVRICGLATIAAALPTVIWRVLVGVGVPLGTPQNWRNSEALPGAGTSYVVTLSTIQLIAALLTLVLLVPGADRVPRRSPVGGNRRFPAGLVVGVSLTGALLLTALCILSVINWNRVDPFRGTVRPTGWAYLCWACYAVTLAWPVMLTATTVGYWRARRTQLLTMSRPSLELSNDSRSTGI